MEERSHQFKRKQEQNRIRLSKKGGELSQLDLAIILAAGEGTRMKSARPKVLHQIAGRSLIAHVLAATSSLQPRETVVVVGAGREQVTEHIAGIDPKIKTEFQEVRGGTGHATRIALHGGPSTGTVLVCAGDTPLLTAQTLQEFFAHHCEKKAAASVLTADLSQPFGYGRIVRSGSEISAIVEERDATPSQKAITEINSGVYIFDIAHLVDALKKVTSDNSQKEEYLTDVVSLLVSEKKKVAAYKVDDETEILGINDRSQLAECASYMRDRINRALQISGVSILDPDSTWVDLTAEIDSDVTIHPGSAIVGNTKIGTGSTIGPRTTLIDCAVEAGAEIIESYCVASEVGKGAKVGPFTHLRAGTKLASDSRAGSFVEIKNSSIGEGSKVPHLSYVGDATIGRESNIGAATIFVNYDGVTKHETIVGDHVRIGSDSMLVAPVTIGDGAYTAAGSVITENVPAGALGLGRSKQVNILGWVLRKRRGTKSAEAAEKKGNNE